MQMAKKSELARNRAYCDRLFNAASSAWDRGDLKQAFDGFAQAAKLGDPGSQVNLGYFFDRGLGVRRNRPAALAWYNRAYRQGDAGAANNIATVHRDLGNHTKSMWWMRRAASMGDLDVVFTLAQQYENSSSTRPRIDSARRLYLQVLASKHATLADKARATKRLAAINRRRGGFKKRAAGRIS